MTTELKLTGMAAYRANQKRVAAVRREFREAAKAAAANRGTFAGYGDFAGAVNAQIALDRTAIDTTAVQS